MKQTIREIRTAKENSSNNRKLKDNKHIDTEKIQQVIKEFIEQYPEVYPFEGLIDFRTISTMPECAKNQSAQRMSEKLLKNISKNWNRFLKDSLQKKNMIIEDNENPL